MGNPAFDPEFKSDAGYRPDAVDFGIFWLLKAGEPHQWVRLWSGHHDHDMPRDLYDTAEDDAHRVYLPLGMPNGLPLIEAVLNGEYVVGEFGMNANEEAVRMLGPDRHLVNGAAIHIGVQDFDGDGQPIGSCDWLGRAKAGKPGFRRRTRTDGATHAIFLPFVAGFYNRNQGQFAVFSPESQRRRSPGDAGCDQLPRISAGMILKWPAPG